MQFQPAIEMATYPTPLDGSPPAPIYASTAPLSTTTPGFYGAVLDMNQWITTTQPQQQQQPLPCDPVSVTNHAFQANQTPQTLRLYETRVVVDGAESDKQQSRKGYKRFIGCVRLLVVVFCSFGAGFVCLLLVNRYLTGTCTTH